MSQEKLLNYYTKNLQKVTESFTNVQGGKEYITFAKNQLEAVKKGGMTELKKFWKTFNLETEVVA